MRVFLRSLRLRLEPSCQSSHRRDPDRSLSMSQTTLRAFGRCSREHAGEAGRPNIGDGVTRLCCWLHAGRPLVQPTNRSAPTARRAWPPRRSAVGKVSCGRERRNRPLAHRFSFACLRMYSTTGVISELLSVHDVCGHTRRARAVFGRTSWAIGMIATIEALENLLHESQSSNAIY